MHKQITRDNRKLALNYRDKQCPKIVTLAWENSRHLATLPLVSPPNDFWETSAEIPYWWRVTNPDLGSASDWSCCVWNSIQQIRSTTQIWVVTRHQYGFSALVSQTSFGGETTNVGYFLKLSLHLRWVVDWTWTGDFILKSLSVW